MIENETKSFYGTHIAKIFHLGLYLVCYLRKLQLKSYGSFVIIIKIIVRFKMHFTQN